MKISNLIHFILYAIGFAFLLYILSLRQGEGDDCNSLKDKNFILQNRIESLITMRRDILDFSVVHNFNDSIYSSLTERIAKEANLVLLIPKNPCHDCYIQEYNKLKLLHRGVQDNIIILTNFEKTRDIKIFLNFNNLDYPIYNSVLPIFNEFKESKNPMLFLIDSSYIPQYVFVPVSFIPELSDKYFDFIVSDFFRFQQELKGNMVEINIDKSVYNFGELKLNEIAETQFEIQNVSNMPFIINDVKPDCGCTVVDWDRNPLPTGKKTLIKLQYNAHEGGFFSKKVSVFSNALDSPHILMIKGKVNQ